MNPVTLAWIIFASVGAVTGILLELLIRGVALLWNKTRPWGYLLDEEGGPDYFGPLRISEGKLRFGKGDNEKSYPVKDAARRNSNKGSIYLITRQKGVNLVVPTKDDIEQTLNDREKVFFEVCDPLLLARVIKARTTQETLEGQGTKDDWKKGAIIPLTIIAGLAIIAISVVVAVLGAGR